MSEERNVPKVGNDQNQDQMEKYLIKKAETVQHLKSNRLAALKKRNNLIGLVLAGGVLDGYTLYSVRQGKLMEAFDKAPE